MAAEASRYSGERPKRGIHLVLSTNIMNKGGVLNLRIEYASESSLDLLRPLWLCLHRHHQTIAPNLRPYVAADTSWTPRRRFYANCLSHKESFAFSHYSVL